ncbi:MAG: hypothetical protein DMF54_02595 [Acidobacteria bacterium]|nr:MAG: hypothetical protein DMF54_02595 [Acidobacteriota bacterium]
MQFCTDSEAAPAVPAIESDPTESLVLGELANGDFEGPGRLVEFQGNETAVENARRNRTDPL